MTGFLPVACVSASADSFVSEAGSIFKTRIEGANNAATGLTGIMDTSSTLLLWILASLSAAQTYSLNP